MIKTVKTVAGVNKILFDEFFRYFWIKNKGAANVHVSARCTIGINNDCTAELCAGDCVRVDNWDDFAVYVLGAGEVEIHAQDKPDCPFKLSAKGGATVDDAQNINAVEYPLIGLNMYGASTQDGTPTPETPVNIVNVGDDGAVNIVSHGKNIFDFEAWKNITYVADATYTIIDNGINVIVKSTIPTGDGRVNTGYLIDVTPEKKYTLSMDTATNQGYAVVYGNNNSDIAKLYATGTRCYLTFNVPGDVTQVRILLRFDRANETNTFSNFQLEEGSAATGYEPFQGYYTATITSGLPLCSVGDVRDELIYNADGTGKIVKRTAKLDSYNGETITTDYISSTGGLDTGAEVVYVLKEPQEIELTAAELDALQQLQTFDGVTNIYNDENAEMNVKVATNSMFSEFVKPILDGHEKRIADLEAAVLSLGGNI